MSETETAAATQQVLAAQWVLTGDGPIIRDGVVAIEGGRIAWVGERMELPSRCLRWPVRSFPRAMILPGWVNAHSHLNLTGAIGQIPGTADAFPDWLRGVIRFQSALPPPLVRQSIVAGLDLLATTGTTTVAHLSTLPELEPFLAHPLRSVVFHEGLGFQSARAKGLAAEAEEWLDAAEALIGNAAVSRVSLGVAAHAPYSTSPELTRRLSGLALRRRIPFSIHLAETPAEAAFLRDGSGGFEELLSERGVWDAQWRPPRVSPIRYAAELGALRPIGTAAHCNYVQEGDPDLLAKGRLTPAWCPGSHAFFGHARHPAEALLAAGIPVALGTDSLASNAGLNMLREVRLASQALPEVPREAWVRAATISGARALGVGELTGSLEEGKAADLQVLDRLPEDTTDPLDALFQAVLRVRAVMVDGCELRIR